MWIAALPLCSALCSGCGTGGGEVEVGSARIAFDNSVVADESP